MPFQHDRTHFTQFEFLSRHCHDKCYTRNSFQILNMQKNNLRTEKFDIRLSSEEQELIRLAASLQSTSPTSFIRQQAVVAAQTVIHENNRFVISDEQWQVIERVLNRKAKVLPNLKNKLSGSDEWDK